MARLRVVLLLLVTLLTFSAHAATASAPTNDSVVKNGDEAALVVLNRQVALFRSTFMGSTAKARADKARILIEETLRQGGQIAVSLKPHAEGQLVMLNDRLAFVVTPGDTESLHDTPEMTAKLAAQRLEQIVSEAREAHSMEFLATALVFSAIASLILGILLWGLKRLWNWLERILLTHANQKAKHLRIGDAQVFDGHSFFPFLRRLLLAARWSVVVVLIYEWLSFVLSRFPYTRPWGERLNDYFWGVAEELLANIFGAVPGLGVALAIFLIARGFIGFVGRFFARIATSPAAPHWIGPDTMPTTRRLFGVAIWLFAVAMAYPYLPGSQTEAFKGLSVLLGIMVSLGASSIVGQGAAGLILVYTRTIHAGEFVRIGEHEGTVVKMGMFTTRIRTGLGEELTIPNSLITNSITKNYSRAVDGHGYIVDTVVTIGYDTPWRQVEAMLIEAARRTPGIAEHPAPQVFQTSLSDFYPEYRLVAQALPERPRPRAEVLTALHANIQDVFNEYGVQIMSPHYLADPAEPKTVNRENWYAAPARPAPVTKA